MSGYLGLRDRHFTHDPATYLVAVDDVNQAYAGLARVWNNPGHPRLDLIGVMPGYRRRAGPVMSRLGPPPRRT